MDNSIIADQANELLEAALKYAANGWRVLPTYWVREDGKCSCGADPCRGIGKHARIGEWSTAASTDPEQVKEWWRESPKANVAILVEDHLVFDVDPKNGGLESLARFEQEYGKLEAHARQRSGSLGYHYWFALPEGRFKKGAIKGWAGLELRTGDNYMVVYPSIHASGNRYEWLNEPSLLNVRRDEIALTDAPEALIAISNGKTPKAKDKPGSRQRAPRAPKGSMLKIQRHLERAVKRVQLDSSGRNNAGFWMFCRMLDDLHTKADCEAILPEWVRKANEAVPGDPFEMNEAEASLRSALNTERKPFKCGSIFWADDDGVYAFVKENDEEKGQDIRISGLVDILSQGRDSDDDNASRRLVLRTEFGVDRIIVVPKELFYAPGRECIQFFAKAGLEIDHGPRSEDMFLRYLKSLKSDVWYRSVKQIGWHGDAFVLPEKIYGSNPTAEIVYHAQTKHRFEVQGTLDEWRSRVAAQCAGNSRLVFSISCGFAAALLAPLGSSSLCFHLQSDSTRGKTTAQAAAGSVQGGGDMKDGFVRSWKSTANALEGTAASHNHSLLCLDELGLADAKTIGEVVYMLVSGSGKERMDRNARNKEVAKWSLLLLSSGEVHLEELMKSVDKNRSAKAGQEVRFIDIPAIVDEAKTEMGVFENIHGAANPRQFADDLNDATIRGCYGSALDAWLSVLVAQRAAIVESAKQYMSRFKEGRDEKVDPQVLRVAQSFAIVAAAGEIATAEGITGWKAGEAMRGVGKCFDAWLEKRGTKGSSANEAGVKQVRRFMQGNRSYRFQTLYEKQPEGLSMDRAIPEQAGFKYIFADGRVEYWIYRERFQSDVCTGFDHQIIAKELAKRGMLVMDGRHYAAKRAVPEVGRIRVIVLKSSIIDDNIPEEEQLKLRVA